jgi:hypothetical protein
MIETLGCIYLFIFYAFSLLSRMAKILSFYPRMRKILLENRNKRGVKIACLWPEPRLAGLCIAILAERIRFSQNFIARGAFFVTFLC